MNQSPQSSAPTTTATTEKWSVEAVKLAFQEYTFLAEDTAKISDRRQTINTLFVSINALFLTGAGYLLLQVLDRPSSLSNGSLFLYTLGFLAILIITWLLNSAWLRLSEQYSRFVNLRIRYLEQLEAHMRASDAAVFPAVQVELQADEVGSDGKNVTTVRGTYTLENVLYGNLAKRQPFGFTRAEKLVGRTFNWAYRIAFIAVLAVALINFFNLHVDLGPIHF